MKNKRSYLLIVLVLALVFALSMMIIACDDDENGSGSGGSGTTVDNGSVVTIQPPNDGFKKGEYRVTVLYSADGSIAEGVEVLLYLADMDDEPYSGATTGNDGVAILQAALGLDYYVRLDRVPDGYNYEESSILEDSTSATIYLEDASATNRYSFRIVSEGGLPMSGLSVKLKDGNSLISDKKTADDGSVSFKVNQLGVYDIEISGYRKGYFFEDGTSMKTSATEISRTFVLKSAVIDEKVPETYRYEMDDIMYDFTVDTDTGERITLSDLLETKKLVMINFWYANCGPCKAEFEGLQNAYEKYEDDMAIIALSTKDNLTRIAKFRSEYSPKLTFYMAPDSDNLFGTAFYPQAQGATPTSIFIDRYGKICNFVKGSATQAYFEQQFAYYTDENYGQSSYVEDNSEMIEDTVAKPNLNMDASESIVAAIAPTISGGVFTEEGDGVTWPWILDKDGEYDVLRASNLKLRSTTAVVTYEFKIGVGEFLTFDYKTNTEDILGADVLSAYIDDAEVLILDRVTDGEWVTCTIYTPLSAALDPEDASRTHTLMLMYAKDTSDSWLQGEEVVSIKNIRTVGLDDLKGDVNIYRNAVWDYNETADDDESPWNQHVEVVLNDADGYYHVGSVDGPLLLANIGGLSRYSGRALYSLNELSSSGYFYLYGLATSYGEFISGVDNPPEDSYTEESKGYAWLAVNSSLANYCPVDKRLKIVLDGIAEGFWKNKYKGNSFVNYYDVNTWLEFCVYFDNYHGEEIENPIIGICQKEAIPAEIGTADSPVANHVVVDRTLVPRGIIYSFTPTVSGVYRIYSDIPEEYSSQQGGFCYVTDNQGGYKEDDSLGDFDIYFTGIAGRTYYAGVAFDSPDSLGEMDFYIEYVAENLDRLTYCADGGVTWVLDEDDNPVYENGQVVMVVIRHNDIQVELGTDNVWHQVLADGSIDMGENSEIYIAIAVENYLYGEGISLEAIAKASPGYFDFTLPDGVTATDEYNENYTEYILNLAAESKQKDITDPTYGMVKATKDLVEIITKAIRTNEDDRNEDFLWLAMSYYYEHLGVR